MRISEKLKGRITGIQPYGAFVELETGTIGLIHISEIRTGYIENIRDILHVNDPVLVQVMNYSNDLDYILKENVKILVDWINNKRGPFSQAYVNIWYKRYVELKSR